MSPQPIVQPFGTWPSTINPVTLLATTVLIDGPRSDGKRPYWGEVHFEEGARCGVWTLRDGEPHRLTPLDDDIRSTLYEYGGGAWNVDRGVLAYVDHATQTVKVIDAVGSRVIGELGDGIRLGDLMMNTQLGFAVAVRELACDDGYPAHAIVALPLDAERPAIVGELDAVVHGCDFYAAPRLNDQGDLAWVEWDHPHMPWTQTRVMIAALDRPDERTVVAGELPESALYPTWVHAADSGWSLMLCSDRSGHWNLYRWDGRSLTALAPIDADIAMAPWALGGQPYAVGADGVVTITWYADDGTMCLGEIHPDGLRQLDDGIGSVGRIAAGPDWTAADIGRPTRPVTIQVRSRPAGSRDRTLHSSAPPLPDADISRAQPMWWDGEAGPVHGWYYPPASARYAGPAAAVPPLIVLTHGGPTSMAHGAFGMDRQIWTNRGFALLDVNYSGSAGFGRAYRQRLDGRWGELDVSDCIRGVEAVVARGLADPAALFIRGASAGGYTTLRAISTSTVFAGAVSIYGISDLAAMARDTHKFESRYLERLVGADPSDHAHYWQRSPLRDLDQIRCPLLMLHGSEDKVVPLNQAQLVVDSLKQRRVPVELIVFEAEGHGFRRPATLETAFNAELDFYQRILCRTDDGDRRT